MSEPLETIERADTVSSPVRCVIVEPIPTQPVGSRLSTISSYTLGNNAESVFGFDPRRFRLVLATKDTGVYIASTRQIANSGDTGGAFFLPSATVIELTGWNEIFCRSATTDTPALLSYIIEYWAN